MADNLFDRDLLGAFELFNSAKPLQALCEAKRKGLRSSSPAEQTCWEKEHRTHKRKKRFKSHTDQPKRQRHQPDDREKEQRKQRQGPGEHEENAPANKEDESLHESIVSSRGAASTARNLYLPRVIA